MDARCLALLREDGADRADGVAIPGRPRWRCSSRSSCRAGMTAADGVRRDRPRARAGGARHAAGALLPAAGRGRRARSRSRSPCPAIARARAQLLALREAVPAAVNARVGRAKQRRRPAHREDRGGHDRAVRSARRAADDLRRGIPRAAASTPRSGDTSPTATCTRTSSRDRSPTSNRARTAILAFGREVIRLGGSPLAEHGVGRNPVKQQLLRELYGRKGIERDAGGQARAGSGVEAGAGVLFPRQPEAAARPVTAASEVHSRKRPDRS